MSSPLPPSRPLPDPPSHPASEEMGAAPAPFVQAGSPVNTLFIAASVLITLYVSWGEDRVRLLPFLISLSPRSTPGMFEEVLHGQFWRLWTPMFLHYSVAHLGFNMVGMYNLGGPLERVIGSRSYVVLCLALALLSNVGQYFIGSSPYFGGMSGVLYGLIGFIWLRSRTDPNFVLQLPTDMIVMSMVWFVACLMGFVGHVANTAHSVGLIVGAIWGVVSGRRAQQDAARQSRT